MPEINATDAGLEELTDLSASTPLVEDTDPTSMVSTSEDESAINILFQDRNPSRPGEK